MKQISKRDVLAKLLQGQTSRQQLEQATNPVPPFLLMLYDLNHPGDYLTDTTVVNFQDRGQTYYMNYTEAKAYANQHQIKTLLVLPDSHRIDKTRSTS